MNEFANDPLVRWKDSIKEVMQKQAGAIEKATLQSQPG